MSARAPHGFSCIPAVQGRQNFDTAARLCYTVLMPVISDLQSRITPPPYTYIVYYSKKNTRCKSADTGSLESQTSYKSRAHPVAADFFVRHDGCLFFAQKSFRADDDRGFAAANSLPGTCGLKFAVKKSLTHPYKHEFAAPNHFLKTEKHEFVAANSFPKNDECKSAAGESFIKASGLKSAVKNQFSALCDGESVTADRFFAGPAGKSSIKKTKAAVCGGKSHNTKRGIP